MPARLLFRDSQGRDGAIDLRGGEVFYIGRSLECAIRTDDAMVSRRHSTVFLDHGHYVIEDLGSSNGTHVNDVRVSRQILHHNDVVRCGSLWLRYVEDGPLELPMGNRERPRPAVREPLESRPETVEESAAAQLARASRIPPPVPARRGVPAGRGLPGTQPAPDDIEASSPFALAPTSPREDSAMAELDDSPGARVLRARLAEAEASAAQLDADRRRESAANEQLRTDIAMLATEVDDLRRAVVSRDEVAQAHAALATELRGELATARQALEDLRRGAEARLALLEGRLAAGRPAVEEDPERTAVGGAVPTER